MKEPIYKDSCASDSAFADHRARLLIIFTYLLKQFVLLEYYHRNTHTLAADCITWTTTN